mgnify:FL=1|tara:strand:+ start:1030 stop:1545 length:516 start_codon:yes stop_codon:yes gene_type:complete
MDIKEINRNIVSIAKTTTNVQDKIQSTLVGCIVHALGKGNGDHTQFTRLVNAMSSGMRRSDCIMWIQLFTPLNWDKEKNAFKKPRKNGRSYMLKESQLKGNEWYSSRDKEIKLPNCDKIFTKTKDEVFVEYMASQDKIIQKIDKENPDSFTGNYNALQERVLKALKALNQV